MPVWKDSFTLTASMEDWGAGGGRGEVWVCGEGTDHDGHRCIEDSFTWTASMLDWTGGGRVGAGVAEVRECGEGTGMEPPLTDALSLYAWVLGVRVKREKPCEASGKCGNVGSVDKERAWNRL